MPAEYTHTHTHTSGYESHSMTLCTEHAQIMRNA